MQTYFDDNTGRTLAVRPEAYVLDQVFTPEYFSYLKNSLSDIKDNNLLSYEQFLGRHHINSLDKDVGYSLLEDATNTLLPKARSFFGQDVQSTYTLFVLYKGFRANLPRHIDDNACTFTIDLCMSYKTQWPIYVEGKEILLEPNQAAVYYGEDQYHWRNKFPDPAKNEVEMIFFHFTKPDHWFFTKGQQYKQEIIRIRNEYRKKNGIKI